VDTDHALFCAQNYPDRKDREQCCEPVPDYLKDLCMEGPPPDKKAAGGDAGGDAGGQEGEKEGGSGKPGGDETVYDIDAWFPESETDALCMRFAHIVPDHELMVANTLGQYDEAANLHVASLICNFEGPDYSEVGYSNFLFFNLVALETADLARQFHEERCAECETDPDCGDYYQLRCINPDPQDVQACFDVEWEMYDWTTGATPTSRFEGVIVVDNTWLMASARSFSEEAVREILVALMEESLILIEEKQTLTLDEVLGEE
jgi:hypothetical protein